MTMTGSDGVYPRATSAFDLALTVSAMRYISDVSSGKVDPAVFSFGLHFDQKKCDLAGTLRTLVSARDVAAELDRMEPRLKDIGAPRRRWPGI